MFTFYSVGTWAWETSDKKTLIDGADWLKLTYRTDSKLLETTRTLKCVSDPAGTLWPEDSFKS